MRKSFIASLKEPSTPGTELPRSAGGGGFGMPSFKAFKVPSSTSSTRSATRVNPASSHKRSRVTFDENQFYDDANNTVPNNGDGDFDPHAAKKAKKAAKLLAAAAGSDDESDKKKGGFVDKYVPPPPPKQFPVYKPKSLSSIIGKGFTIPGMKKRGVLVENRPTNQALGTRRALEVIPRPLFDPMEEMSIVLWDPTTDDRDAERALEKERIEQARKEAEGDTEADELERERRKVHRSLADMLGLVSSGQKKKQAVKVAVVIDPRVGKVLRPHQVEGVKFLYKCVTGMMDENAQGCIMADEMGLGKTLQCISLLWTLLKQSPIHGKSSIDKAIVVCPSSLVRNWANELVKWLGEGVLSPLAIDGSIPNVQLVPMVRQWCVSKGKAVMTPVIIVSYEKLRLLTDELGQTEIGLLLADEGHRLKNSENNTYKTLNEINCKRRVILTGTPVQNDLSEYFSLLNFCNPGYLGTKNEFRKKFENPIAKGRDGDASEKEVAIGEACLKELSLKVNKLIIRRTNDLLSKYLPIKYEHVVFCAPSAFQLDLYKHFVSSPATQALLRGKDSQPLKAIMALRKLCQHPDLVDLEKELPGSESTYPPGYNPSDSRRVPDTSLGGKMAVLDRFLVKMRAESNDKLVLVSNFTTTLDLFEKLLRGLRMGYVRLDGTMNPNKRQKLVDKFNDPDGPEIIFLLSSKAGGCGLNLIGANRLILFDPDWNPASDMQALARVWRDGQKKDCFVYRFVATGTIEEKIFQRQAHKQNLSSCVVDEKEGIERHYTGDNLRQLFQLNSSLCETHDLFKCKRCKNGKQFLKSPAMLYGDTSTWNHLQNEDLANIHDDLLRAETGLGAVTACFQFIST